MVRTRSAKRTFIKAVANELSASAANLGGSTAEKPEAAQVEKTGRTDFGD